MATVAEAVRIARERELLPTSFGTAELRRLDAEARARAVFSARTTNALYVQEIADVLDQALQGKINDAKARELLLGKLRALGYTPEGGFGPQDAGKVPPAPPGGLRDLSSTKRRNLVVETQSGLMRGAAQKARGNQPARADAFPCWELVRYKEAQKPQWERPWPRRWMQAGGEFYGGGRMIARKDDPIWSRLGDSGLFDDALDVDQPPFAFNSGMGWREVARDEAISLGVIEGHEEITPDAAIAEELKTNADQFSPDLLRELKRELLDDGKGGQLSYEGILKAELERARQAYGED